MEISGIRCLDDTGLCRIKRLDSGQLFSAAADPGMVCYRCNWRIASPEPDLTDGGEPP